MHNSYKSFKKSVKGEGDGTVRVTLNAVNLAPRDLEVVVRRELQKVRGGTVIIRNINGAAAAERVARLAMKHGWDVGCSKKGQHFLVVLYKGMLKNASGFAD